jgi:endoglycosylceramidase
VTAVLFVVGGAANSRRAIAAEAAPAPRGELALNHIQKPLVASGRYFRDQGGRAVILRGVNIAGDSKVPPFVTITNPAVLDCLPPLGVNVIRMVFIWEAFEPSPGVYDETYLARLWALAEAAWMRGMYVIIDIHQDGYSRALSKGCGDGFPLWAIPPSVRPAKPDNGCGCKNWSVLMAIDSSVHRAFADFYADREGVRGRYLDMLRRVSAVFGTSPGVIGYDLLNEPWGRERTEITPLYEDAAAAIREQDPSAILFVEGHVTTNCGLQTGLPRPKFGNFAYAPHFYNPVVMAQNCWRGDTMPIDRGFLHMQGKADEWNAPLFVGEFGVGALTRSGGAFVSCIYDRLDENLASGAQWNFTPSWSEERKDGWNGEDFNCLDPRGGVRANFGLRPFPRKIAGVPTAFEYSRAQEPGQDHCLTFLWRHEPALGETEIFVPNLLFPSGSLISVEPAHATCWRDEVRQVLLCRAPRAASIRVHVKAKSNPPARASQDLPD